MESFESVLHTLEQAKAFGFRQLTNGTMLYGHVPHIAPEAWLHQLFSPVSDHDIFMIEEKIGLPVPSQFRDFLKFTNGVNLFSGSLSIYGKRTSYARSGDDAWQPFCVVTANTLDRPMQAKPWQFIVGSYRSDGSLVSIESRDGTAFRTKGRSAKILNRWRDFWTMLMEETSRLAGLFDETGHKLSKESTTPLEDK